MHALLIIIALGAQEPMVAADQLEGPWCLISTTTDALVVDQQEQWHFEPQGTLVVGTDPSQRTQGVYVINGDTIETSLAVQLTVQTLDEEEMVAVNEGTVYQFTRGECDG